MEAIAEGKVVRKGEVEGAALKVVRLVPLEVTEMEGARTDAVEREVEIVAREGEAESEHIIAREEPLEAHTACQIELVAVETLNAEKPDQFC